MPDVVVIGDGVVGLSTAFQLARSGLRCHVLGTRQPGAASSAAAGLLAPNIGNLEPNVRALFQASLALYPQYLAPLQAIDPELQLISGLIEVLDERRAAEPPSHRVAESPSRRVAESPSRRVAESPSRRAAEALDTLQPGVLAPFGAVFHETDAAIDNVRLVAALRHAVEAEQRLTYTDDAVVSVDARTSGVTVTTKSGGSLNCSRLVVAAGAWTPQIDGLPRRLPVRPLKGQMMSLAAAVLVRPVMAGHVYLVPRGGETVVGATSEEAGFDLTIHPETIAGLHRGAAALVPALLSAPIARTWAGTRPATPDLLPIVDQDPQQPSVIYAAGHSRNGILLAPLTALAVAELVLDAVPSFDLRAFSLARFERDQSQ